MKKSEIQAVYQEVKKNRSRRSHPKPSRRPRQGCNTCGRVTWKPYNQ